MRQEPKSLWQKTQESARLFNCFKCCRRRPSAAEQFDDLLDDLAFEANDSQLLDSSELFERREQRQEPEKKLVVPNNN